MYELEDAPGQWYHTDWTGLGGTATASAYQAWNVRVKKAAILPNYYVKFFSFN